MQKRSQKDLLELPADADVQFGQRRIADSFNQYSEAPDFIRGRPIADVAADLRAKKISPDSLPIWYFEFEGELVAMNNRGLAALSEAGMKPTVLHKVPFDQVPKKVLDRLSELETKGTVFRGQTLPGRRIPVTEDKAGTKVIRIIDLPE